jgi:hypothetical protein
MLKPILVGTAFALSALTLPAVAQQATPGAMPSQSGQTPAQREMPAQRDMGTTQTLNLTAEEKHTVLQNVEKTTATGNSTMGLGALTEGAAVPKGAKTKTFSTTVTTKVPKLKTYSYFAADNKVAIVDPKGANIVAVLDLTSPAAK